MAAYFASLGVGKIRFNPLARLGRARSAGDSQAITPNQYLVFMRDVLDYLAETRAFEESNLEALVRNLVLKTRDYRCMRSPCGAGLDYLVVDASGDVYPCSRFMREPALCLGNVSDEVLGDRCVNNETVQNLANRIVSDLTACRTCRWRHFCEGGCGLAANRDCGTLDAPDILCPFYQEIYPFLVGYLYVHPEMVQHFFPSALIWHVSAPREFGGTTDRLVDC